MKVKFNNMTDAIFFDGNNIQEVFEFMNLLQIKKFEDKIVGLGKDQQQYIINNNSYIVNFLGGHLFLTKENFDKNFKIISLVEVKSKPIKRSS